jgi:hypothetical protein
MSRSTKMKPLKYCPARRRNNCFFKGDRCTYDNIHDCVKFGALNRRYQLREENTGVGAMDQFYMRRFNKRE